MFILFVSVVYSHYYSFWVFVGKRVSTQLSYFQQSIRLTISIYLFTGYYNDDFYSQFYHQIFFSFTELVSTVVVLKLSDASEELSSTKLLIIIDIAVLHVLTGGWDQCKSIIATFNLFKFIYDFMSFSVVTNVIKQEGQLHQVLRDLLFMIPDILHIIIALLQLLKLAKIKKRPATHLISNEQFFGSVLLVSALWVLCLVM